MGGHSNDTAVITPSVPSDPTNSCFRSYLQGVQGAWQGLVSASAKEQASLRLHLALRPSQLCSALLTAAAKRGWRPEPLGPPTRCCLSAARRAGPAPAHQLAPPPGPACWRAWTRSAAGAAPLQCSTGQRGMAGRAGAQGGTFSAHSRLQPHGWLPCTHTALAQAHPHWWLHCRRSGSCPWSPGRGASCSHTPPHGCPAPPGCTPPRTPAPR